MSTHFAKALVGIVGGLAMGCTHLIFPLEEISFDAEAPVVVDAGVDAADAASCECCADSISVAACTTAVFVGQAETDRLALFECACGDDMTIGSCEACSFCAEAGGITDAACDRCLETACETEIDRCLDETSCQSG